MPRWVWFLPLAGVLVATGVIAFLLGTRAATRTETEAIEHAATLHVYQGGKLTDCRAVPAQSEELWLVVICEPENGPGREYFIDHYGNVNSWKIIEDGA
ncbi:MAG: hypothetical protein AAGF53_10375 [Pseudomonadota bacterium]